MRAPGIGVLEVVDQLRQILDRIDVMMRRRRDQADAGGGVAHAGDVGVDLVAGQLTALPRLGALGHFYLDVVGIDQILDGHAEPAGGDLLDRRAHRVAVWQRGRSGPASSPPSPVLDLPPMRFIAIASVVWASREIEPKLIAPVANRRTMLAAPVRPPSSGIGVGANLKSIRPRMVSRRSLWSLIERGEDLVTSIVANVAAHRVLQGGHAGFGCPGMRPRHAGETA